MRLLQGTRGCHLGRHADRAGSANAPALIHGQLYVGCENVAAVAPSIMRHRMAVNFSAQSEGITTDDIVARVLAAIAPHER